MSCLTMSILARDSESNFSTVPQRPVGLRFESTEADGYVDQFKNKT